MLNILIINFERMKKGMNDSLEVVAQKYELHVMLLIHKVENILHGPIWPFHYSILIYNMWVHEIVSA